MRKKMIRVLLTIKITVELFEAIINSVRVIAEIGRAHV